VLFLVGFKYESYQYPLQLKRSLALCLFAFSVEEEVSNSKKDIVAQSQVIDALSDSRQQERELTIFKILIICHVLDLKITRMIFSLMIKLLFAYWTKFGDASTHLQNNVHLGYILLLLLYCLYQYLI